MTLIFCLSSEMREASKKRTNMLCCTTSTNFFFFFSQEHKLIRPSRRAVSQHGWTHVQHILDIRAREILDQVTLQLRLKSANRSFGATKKAMKEAAKEMVGS